MPDTMKLLARLYDRFNARDINGALMTMHPDVVWDNDLEGGYVHGHAGVRGYWTRQWEMINTHAEPIQYSHGDDGKVTVEVRLTARDADGNLAYDNVGRHIIQLENGLIKHFEVRARPET